MPLANKNYVTPAWIDNAAPPINDDELNAMSETVEGSQMLVGNGAPTSSTQGKVGQRYADISTTPPTMYQVKSQSFPGQPIPKMQTKSELTTDGYLVAYYGENREEIRVGSDNSHQVTVVTYERIIGYVAIVFACMSPGAQAYITYPELTTGGGVTSVSLTLYNEDSGLYYWSTRIPASNPHDNQAPWYFTLQEALAALKNQPATWEQVQDPNRNLAQEYSTGSSYAAGDCCIYGGWLYKALEATSGAWDGSKWERARYADELSSHVSDKDNPHSVTAAQTGALSGSMIAAVQATTTAARNYAAGDYFLYQGELYVVKEAVAQGTDVFAERTPDEVTVYDMETEYPASAYDSDSVNASLVATGCGFVCERRNNQALAQVIPSSTRYFFRQVDGNIIAVMYSPEWDDMNDATYNEGLYLNDGSERKGAYLFVYRRAKRAGNLYYCTNPFSVGSPYLSIRADDAVMFIGTDAELEQFIAGIPNKKKSEPAVLGDGVTALYPRTGTINLSASWAGSGPYTQTVTVTGADVTGKSKIDLTPTAAQFSQLTADGVLSLTIENVGGTLTAWAVGAQPSGAMTISCVVRETV